MSYLPWGMASFFVDLIAVSLHTSQRGPVPPFGRGKASMHTLNEQSSPTMSRISTLTSTQKQSLLMKAALGLLCVALTVVTVKNWSFWSDVFSPDEQASQTDAPSSGATDAQTQVSQTRSDQSKISTGSAAVSHSTPGRSHSKLSHPLKNVSVPAQTAVAPTITATNRTVLPPLEIEVVAGNRHENLQSNKRSVDVEIQTPVQQESQQPATEASVGDDGVTTSASSRTPITVSRQVAPNYPVLAKQMKVQGAVIMEALIGRSGSIQDLRVLSGPAILSAAAREAVKQWHFKPYLLAGQAVETEARITVNFTISTD